MAADSKDVAKALKIEVFPILRDAGFARFKSRTAWRDGAETICVVDFRSLGSYLGSAVGVTSHSFGAVAGTYFKAVHATPWSKDPVPDMPEEHAGQPVLQGTEPAALPGRGTAQVDLGSEGLNLSRDKLVGGLTVTLRYSVRTEFGRS